MPPNRRRELFQNVTRIHAPAMLGTGTAEPRPRLCPAFYDGQLCGRLVLWITWNGGRCRCGFYGLPGCIGWFGESVRNGVPLWCVAFGDM